MNLRMLKKSVLTLLLGLVCNVAWADFTHSWTASPVAPWGTSDCTDYPEGVGAVLNNAGSVRLAETEVVATKAGDVTVKFVFSGGSHKLNVLGVDLVDAIGTVVASDYHHGTTGNSHNNNIYTLANVAVGEYTLRYFAGHNMGGDQLNNSNGKITVVGLDRPGVVEPNIPKAGSYYRIGYDFGGSVGVKYMQSVNSSVKGLAMTDEKGENAIFLVEEVSGNLRLKSLATGKYLKEDGGSRGLYDTGGNVTFSEGTDGKYKIQAPSYLHANSSGENYFIDHCGNDGCAAHNFIVEEVVMRTLKVDGPAYTDATVTWNGETKAIPASWALFEGVSISDPTLTVNSSVDYTFEALKEGETLLTNPIEISNLEADRTLTATFSPAFFSEKVGDKWINIVRKSAANHAMFLANAAEGAKPTFNTKDYTNTGMLWCFVGSANSFKIYNYLSSDTLALTPSAAVASIGDGTEVKMVEVADAQSWKLIEKNGGYAITPVDNTNWSLNSYGGNGSLGGNIKFYGAGDNGSHWNVDIIDTENILTMGVFVDEVWESSPRVAELTFGVNGANAQTRITGSINAAKYYLPKDSKLSISSMTYRGYTFNGIEGVDAPESITIPEGGLNLNVSYTANAERTLFYTPGATGAPYRIPAIATAPNGDIFAICDYRPCGGDIGNGDVDIVCRISSDNGVTWGDEIKLADGDGGSTNRMETGYGDPAIVVDCESNKILVMMVAGRTVCGNSRWDASKIGVKDASLVNRAARIYGTLNESTGQWEWTQPEEVTDDIYKLFLDESNNATVTSYFIGSGKICQSRVVKKGEYYRLYCALWTRDQGNRVIYSDDFGGTWNVLGTINDRPASDGNEPKCEELPDGTVVLSSRVPGGRYFNIFTFADDTYTAGSWGSVVKCTTTKDGSNQGTNGEIYKISAVRKSDNTACDVMLQSVPAGPGRSNVTVYYKEMDYATPYTPATFAEGWNVGKLVSDKESAYSTMILQADNRIAFFYEEAPGGYTMVYIPFTLEELTDGKYTIEKTTTAILGVPTKNVDATGVIYDLSGRRVNHASKGVYIVDGKKVVM